MISLKSCIQTIITVFNLFPTLQLTSTIDYDVLVQGQEDRFASNKKLPVSPVCASNMVTYANYDRFKIAKIFNPELKILERKNCSAVSYPTTLDDIFISVKSTSLYERSRLPLILSTWFQTAKNQTWIFSDGTNENLQKILNNHLIDTRCPPSHSTLDLCCKTAVEFDYYIQSGKKWFCHFDDDNYVYVPRLVEVLRRFNHRKDWYLGRPRQANYDFEYTINDHASTNFSFRFALLGAGMCISQNLAHKVNDYAGGRKFLNVCNVTGLNDDVTLGFLTVIQIGQEIFPLEEFNSQNELMRSIPREAFRNKISFSYYPQNVLDVDGFDAKSDPTRFLSLHCFFYPQVNYCKRMQKKVKVRSNETSPRLLLMSANLYKN